MILILLIFAIVFAAVVCVFVVIQHQLAERRALLHALAIAADANVPLHEVALAISDESILPINMRAHYLGSLLQSGLPLDDALRRSHPGLPDEVRVAVTTGTQMGCLGASLSGSVQQQDDTQTLLRPVLLQILYLMLMFFFTCFVLSSIMIFIMPVYKEMFVEFALALPTPTVLLIAASDYIAKFWYLGVPFFLLAMAFMLLIALKAFGWQLSFLPIFNRLSLAEDRAGMLRAIATGIRSGWPVQKTVHIVGDTVRNSIIRARLRRAVNAMDNGVSWSDALSQSSLLRPREVAVVDAATRVGNVAWALQELSQGIVRRKLLRMRALVSTLMPLAILLIGAIIGLIVVGIFMPLATMILELDKAAL